MNHPLKPAERMEVPSYARLIWISVLTLFVSMGAAAAISVIHDSAASGPAASRSARVPAGDAAPSWAVPVPSASEVLPITSGGYPEDAPSTF